MAVPSGLFAGAPVIVATGFTLVTVIVFVSTPLPPSASLAVRVTTYEPLPLGANEKPAPEPVVYAAPFFVTLQAYVRTSFTPASVDEPVRLICVPSGEVPGAPVIVATGF